MKITHPLWRTLRSLKGNQRACVLTEPLWAIPNNLFMPFASIYMAAIGLQDVQIGMVASLGMATQFLSGLLSGAIVDKYGRRRTMLVFGLLSWLIPCMLWAGARGYWYFIFAAVFNGMWRVTGNSFSCMIIEDGDSGQLINIYTILNLFGLLEGFISTMVTVLLLCLPFAAAAIWAVFFSAICEAFALAVLGPLSESMMSVAIPAKERARANSLIIAMIFLISIPVGRIAGQLSQRDRMLPLALNLCLLIAEVLMVLIITRISKK